MKIPESYNQLDQWTTVMFLYNSALKAINTKIEIMNNEFIHLYNYTPIEHIKSRLKTPDSIVKKLKRNGHEVTIPNMIEYLSDVAGVRIICSFNSDIYQIADMLTSQPDITVLNVKDYIRNPKPNGYKSYHLVVTIPIYLSGGPVDTKVEIQIRTVGMDFWASLEHKIYYKFEGTALAHLEQELKACANVVDMLDDKMCSLNQEIMQIGKQQRAEAKEKAEAEREAKEAEAKLRKAFDGGIRNQEKPESGDEKIPEPEFGENPEQKK